MKRSLLQALALSAAQALTVTQTTTAMSDPHGADQYREASIEQRFRFGPITRTDLISTATIKWYMYTQTNLNEDTGVQNLRITHELHGNIQKDDTVTFEVAFVPVSKWDNVDDSDYANGLGEDAGRCDLSINSTDPQFWDVTLTDIYYKCNGTPAVSTYVTEPNKTKCSGSGNNYNSNSVLSESSSNNQWTSPFKDDDEDLHWCYQANTEGGTYSPFQCSRVKCVMERLLDTGDTTYDWAFDASTVTADGNGNRLDYMRILNGRAQLWIKSSTYTVALTAPYAYEPQTSQATKVSGGAAGTWNKEYLDVPIYANAVSLASALSLTALVGLVAF